MLAACPGVVDAVAYGVDVPGTEGKAGMAALVVDGGFALAALHAHLAGALPGYARPLFVRLCPAIARTGTFKLGKHTLARDGLATGEDALWFADRAAGGYVLFDPGLRARIAGGSIPL